MLSRTNFNYGFFNFNSMNNNSFFNNYSLNSWSNNYFNNSRTNNLFSFNNTNNWLNNSFTNRNTFNLFNTNNWLNNSFTNRNTFNLFNTNNNSFWNNIVWTTQPALTYDTIYKPTFKLPEDTKPAETIKEPKPISVIAPDSPVGPGGTRWEAEQKPIFSKILGTDLNDDIYEFKFDEEGRVVEIESKMHSFGPSGYTSSLFGLMSPTGYCDTTSGYRVSYDDDGNIKIIKYTKTTPTDSKGNATGESETVNIEDIKKYNAGGNEIHETGDFPVLDPEIWDWKDLYY